jgi:RNA polymerase sigma-70 factor (ECF subfamily)
MEALYYRHRNWVYTQAFRICGNREDALDVLQEVFSYFFLKFPGFELRSQLRTYLYRVARSMSINLVEKRRKIILFENGQSERLMDTPVSPNGRLGFDELIAHLNDDDRELVVLRFAEEFSLPEIAEALSLPLGTVKSRLHRALSQLRQKANRH